MDDQTNHAPAQVRGKGKPAPSSTDVQLAALTARLEAFEHASSDQMRQLADHVDTLIAQKVAVHLGQIRDVAARLEQDSGQRYVGAQTTVAALAERLDRIDSATTMQAAALKDALARVEADAGSRYEQVMATLASLSTGIGSVGGAYGQRLDDVGHVLQRIEATGGTVRDATSKLEAAGIAEIAAAARDAAARLEADSAARYEALVDAVRALSGRLDAVDGGQGQRLDGIGEALHRIEATGGTVRDATSRLEAAGIAGIAAAARDAASRLEIDSAARHEAFFGAIRGLFDRIDVVEASQAQRFKGLGEVLQRVEALSGYLRDASSRLEAAGIADLAAAARDAAARLEIDAASRHQVFEEAARGLFERIERMEAVQGRRLDDVSQVLQRLEATGSADHDAIARIEADACRRFEVLAAWRVDVVSALRRLERLAARTGVRPYQPVAERGSDWADFDVTARITLKTRPLRTLVDNAGLMPWAEMGPVRIRNDLGATSPLAAANAALADFLADRVRIAAGERLLWILPVTEDETISNEEAEQIFGLLGRVETIARTRVADADTLFIAGSRRREEILPVLRWSAQALDFAFGESLPEDRIADSIRDVLVPVFDLPRPGSGGDPAQWAKRAALVMGRFGGAYACTHGVTVPREALDDPAYLEPWLVALRTALGPKAPSPLIQWVRDPIPVARSAEVLDLGTRIGVAVDLTATARDVSGGAFAAYDDMVAYKPMRFDLRLPSPTSEGVVCIARREMAAGGTNNAYGTRAERLAKRLRLVLRRDVTRRFTQAVAAEPNQMAGQWEQHHIYNWRPVPDTLIQAMVFDAEFDLADVTSSLTSAETPFDLLNALPADLTRLGRHVDFRVGARANVDLQVHEHTYLTERVEPSADSLRLASWFPEWLGETLELGSGYCVLAQHFIARTSRYVGVDLTVAQGQAARGLGGLPVVADIHALPLSDGQFDTVIADNVIEHATEPVKALAELRRVLKPGGAAYLVLPLDYLGPDYRNPSHHWKADVDSILAAMAGAELDVVRHEVCIMPAIGAKGSFPSCNQRTSLWEVRRPPGAASRRIRTVDFRAETRAIDAGLAATAERASEDIIVLNARSELGGLSRRSPSLKGFDWSAYLRLSELRFVRAAAHLARRGVNGRVLDLGSYFGNLALLLARSGWSVTALDSYREYGHALDRHTALLRHEGVDVRDFDEVGFDLLGFDAASYDAVCCMGVIEHVPHTPRLLLEAVDRVLKPGGWLVLDTPNLAYDYQRAKLARGETVFAPLAQQFETDIPFEGHHREYTPAEVRWMMERIGYSEIGIDLYNYSLYGLGTLSGDDLVRFEAMQADPERRELIMAIARKPPDAAGSREAARPFPARRV